ncbi:MAG TPA: ATP-binding protein [Pilimelia sp.]|nr:ATP-binding protein [Pilimelia sp.]
MSFRLRVLLLVVLVAVTATAATAWVTLSQASRQVIESAAVDRAQLDLVGTALREYGARHGTWEGVPAVVGALHQRTGQRIHLVSEGGIVIVDTDTEAGRRARPLGAASVYVDPRPRLALPAGGDAGHPPPRSGAADLARRTAAAITAYRAGIRFATCLTRAGVGVVTSPGELGVPRFAAPARLEPRQRNLADLCRRPAATEEAPRFTERVARCAEPELAHPQGSAEPTDAPGRPAPTEDPVRACLARTFTEEISDLAAVPAMVYLGARDEPAATLATGPLLAAAAGVALVVILGTVLLSHRVLRPIGRLTTATQRFGQGDLASRVPVRGRDELADLGRAFNRMADSLRRSEERQRMLIADVAHELRTPLANLRGYLEALADGVIAPDAELFASLHEEAVLQQRIVDDLQELALAESGRLVYHRMPVDVAELLETCRTAHRASAASAGVTLSVQVGSHAASGPVASGLASAGPAPSGPASAGPVEIAPDPLLVHADPDRLRQALGNLLTNALRATPRGGSVSLSTGRSGETVAIRVADTGTGIAPDALPHVFERFWRADPARGRRTGGAGLGLAIVRQIVADHGGAITVVSEVGAGTEFTVTLPAARPGAPRTTGAARTGH